LSSIILTLNVSYYVITKDKFLTLIDSGESTIIKSIIRRYLDALPQITLRQKRVISHESKLKTKSQNIAMKTPYT